MNSQWKARNNVIMLQFTYDIYNHITVPVCFVAQNQWHNI